MDKMKFRQLKDLLGEYENVITTYKNFGMGMFWLDSIDYVVNGLGIERQELIQEMKQIRLVIKDYIYNMDSDYIEKICSCDCIEFTTQSEIDFLMEEMDLTEEEVIEMCDSIGIVTFLMFVSKKYCKVDYKDCIENWIEEWK